MSGAAFDARFLDPAELVAWRGAATFTITGPERGFHDVQARVGIAGAGGRWRVDFRAGAGASCFRDVRCVGEVVFVGWGECVVVVSPHESRVASRWLDGYFGHLVTAADEPDLGASVLASSASELLCFDAGGRLSWRSAGLGIDGVIVRGVDDGRIRGDGEWDPPGGWEPFVLDLASGERLPG